MLSADSKSAVCDDNGSEQDDLSTSEGAPSENCSIRGTGSPTAHLDAAASGMLHMQTMQQSTINAQDLRDVTGHAITEESVLSESLFRSDDTLVDQIWTWAVKCSVTQVAVSALLKRLKTHPCHSHFPTDARTLLNTPRGTASRMSTMGNGKYCHFGVSAEIQAVLDNESEVPTTIRLVLNIYCLPISKRSRLQFSGWLRTLAVKILSWWEFLRGRRNQTLQTNS